MSFDTNKIILQPLLSLSTPSISVTTLRTDLIHPIVSGNKWFKLRFYLQEAQQLNKQTIASFGGAYSNHIVALAAVCKMNGLNAIGFIRGETGNSPSLIEAESLGMKLHYLSREEYKNKEAIMEKFSKEHWYWIKEGGFGKMGAKGAATMLTTKDCTEYSHIICACGTGTMMAGLISGAQVSQKVIGISVLKNNSGLDESINSILPPENKKTFTTIHDYHFGGYAKHPPTLINYMNDLYKREQLPTDIVYTSKLYFAVEALIKQGHFDQQASILIIHSGGLQGNRSLPNNCLLF